MEVLFISAFHAWFKIAVRGHRVAVIAVHGHRVAVRGPSRSEFLFNPKKILPIDILKTITAVIFKITVITANILKITAITDIILAIFCP